MGGSWRIARVAGINIFVHWTFSILLAWIVIAYLWSGSTWLAAAEGVALIIAIFGCVVLHELGHALTAQRFNIQTRDITLLPIGGLARLERIPEEPHKELLIALAGPAVNVVIAALLFAVIGLTYGLTAMMPDKFIGGNFIVNLMVVNVVLVVFNMLPAFPMDGGRVLRALLGYWTDHARATSIAASVGQGMAILFGLLGLATFNPFLLFIALFVYLGAEAENRMAQMKLILAGIPVWAAMMTRYKTLSPDDSLEAAADELLAGTQRDFPVMEDGTLIGMLRQMSIVQGIRGGGLNQPIRELIDTDFSSVEENERLDRVVPELQRAGVDATPVMHNGNLVGLLSTENIGEFMMIRTALMKRGDSPNLDRSTVEHHDEPLQVPV